MKLIKGQIAEILDSYTVVINKGRINGVEEGMRFAIYEEGMKIKDPNTKDSLGVLEIVKAKVKVNYVQEKICTAKTYETTFAFGGLYTALSTPMTVLEELPLDDKSIKKIQERPKKSHFVIVVGDPVKQIIE